MGRATWTLSHVRIMRDTVRWSLFCCGTVLYAGVFFILVSTRPLLSFCLHLQFGIVRSWGGSADVVLDIWRTRFLSFPLPAPVSLDRTGWFVSPLSVRFVINLNPYLFVYIWDILPSYLVSHRAGVRRHHWFLLRACDGMAGCADMTAAQVISICWISTFVYFGNFGRTPVYLYFAFVVAFFSRLVCFRADVVTGKLHLLRLEPTIPLRP